MSTELAKSQDAPQEPESAAIIRVIERAAMNPEVDIDKMERLLGMQERIMARQQQQEWAAAMTRAQQRMPAVVADSDNKQTNSKYAKLDKINRAITPIYTAEGFSLSFGEEDCPTPDHIRVTCDVRHSMGHCERYHWDTPIDSVGIQGKVNKTMVHAKASSTSYGRRYLTCQIFNIATGDDDDGQAAGGAAPVDTITEDEALDIKSQAEELKLPIPKLLEVVSKNVGYRVESISDIPANFLRATLNYLEKRRAA